MYCHPITQLVPFEKTGTSVEPPAVTVAPRLVELKARLESVTNASALVFAAALGSVPTVKVPIRTVPDAVRLAAQVMFEEVSCVRTALPAPVNSPTLLPIRP
jgi:hypothetical protein